MSTDSQKKGTGANGRRWLWPVLVGSVALNLLFVGLFAGNLWTHSGKRAGRHQIFTQAFERLMEDLSPEKRQHARELVERYRANVEPQRDRIRDAIREARAAIKATPYDEARVSGSLARIRELRTSQHQSSHAMLMELLSDLTLEERETLMQYIREGYRGKSKRSGKQPKPE